MQRLQRLEREVETLVYIAHSPEHGPEQRLYTEDDIHIAGGLNGIEQQLQRETYWYGRVGEVKGRDTEQGVTFDSRVFAGITIPRRAALAIGRRHPAFNAGKLERYVFDALCDAVDILLGGWKRKEGSDILAYVIKQVRVSPTQLRRLTSALCTGRSVYEVTGVTALRYWYSPDWPDRHYEEDLCLAEFSLMVPMKIDWARAEES